MDKSNELILSVICRCPNSKVVEVCKVLGLAIGWLVGVGDAHGAWLLGQECVESEVSMQAKRYIATESREGLSAVV